MDKLVMAASHNNGVGSSGHQHSTSIHQQSTHASS
jgi:hypothetical protein